MRTSTVLLAAATTVALTATALTTAGAADAQRTTAHRAGKAYAVTAKASTDELVLGKKVTIKGKVSPAAPGQKVLLQKKVGSKPWHDEAQTKLNGHSKYTFSDRPSTANRRIYRVVIAAHGKHARGISPKRAVTVYAWHDLHSLAIRASDRIYKSNHVSIDTVDFPRSLLGYSNVDSDIQAGFVDFNLTRQCIELKSTFGMDDSADTDSSVQLDVVADGATIYSRSFALLESEAKTLSIRNVFRLAFQFTNLNTAVDSRPAVASPRVLCSF